MNTNKKHEVERTKSISGIFIPQRLKGLRERIEIVVDILAHITQHLCGLCNTIFHLLVSCARLFGSVFISCLFSAPYRHCIFDELFDTAIAFSAFSANSVV